MNKEQKKKFETIVYMLTKTAARQSFSDFLEEDCGVEEQDWEDFKKYVTSKTGIEFKYLQAYVCHIKNTPELNILIDMFDSGFTN